MRGGTAAAVWALSIAACHPAPRPLPAAYRPLSIALLDASSDPGAVTGPQTISAEARLTYYDGKQRLRGTAYLMAARPDRFRFEVDGVIGAGGAFACDGTSVSILDTGQRTLDYLPAAALGESLAMMRVPLTCADFFALLAGHLPAFDTAGARLAYDPTTGVLTAEYPYRGGWWVAAFDPIEPPPAPLREVTVWQSAERSGQPLWSVQYGERISVGAYHLPHSLQLVSKPHDVDTSFVLRDIEVDTRVESDVFTIACPRTYRCSNE
jgi:outer membrane lipoprotein-sorting protein